MIHPLVVYRGRYQPRRLDLVVDALRVLGHEVIDIAWLAPQGEIEECELFAKDLQERHSIDLRIRISSGRWLEIPRVRRALKTGTPRELVVILGSGGPSFVPSALGSHVLWLVQGIPEERLFPTPTVSRRLKVVAEWAAIARHCPQTVVAPTERMRHLVEKRCHRVVKTHAIPNTAPLDEFRSRTTREVVQTTWVYVGSGAPWQELNWLFQSWMAASVRDTRLRFRVVSKDPAVRGAIPGDLNGRLTVVEAETPRQVASALADAELAFLLRANHLLNQVAWPVKFSEYIAAYVPVLTTELDWDIADFVREHQCGILVPASSTPDEIAREALGSRGHITVNQDARLAVSHVRCADRLAQIMTSRMP